MRTGQRSALVPTIIYAGVLITAAPTAFGASQEGSPALLGHLRAGRLDAALAQMEAEQSALNAAEALQAAELFTSLAGRPKTDPKLARTAFEQALVLLDSVPPGEFEGRREGLIGRTQLALGSLIASENPRPLTAPHREAVEALDRARTALKQADPPDLLSLKSASILLIPMIRDLKRTGQLLALCRETLELPLTPSEASLVNRTLGEELLGMGRTSEALTHLEGVLRENPTDPELVGPVAQALLRSETDRALLLLLPVIRTRPVGDPTNWTACLEHFYRALVSLPVRDEPLRSLLPPHQIDLPMPQIWPGISWKPGFRVWRPDDTVPGKTYAGRHSLKAMVPFSAGWSRRSNAPQELRRWDNVAFCLQRAGDGPTLVAYWFAPDLAYWYGTTPRERGLTSRTIRGDSRGGVASMVQEACYGPHARERGQRFSRAPSLPFPLGTTSGVIRQSWRTKSHFYHEYFFSIGQVTVEILLVIRQDQLELLEPEIRWLLRSIGY